MRNLSHKFIHIIVLVTLFSLGNNAWAEPQAIPPLKQRVTDLTNTLTQQQITSLDNNLAKLEASKGSQLAILIVPTTKPETIETFSLRVVEKWKLGRKDVDDGILLLIALQDRAMRIEIGYGLEGTIPDAIAGRIIRDYMTPAFREGDYFEGIQSAVERLSGLINGEPLPEHDLSNTNDPSDYWSVLGPSLFVATLLGKLFFIFYGQSMVFGRPITVAIICGITVLIIFIVFSSIASTIATSVVTFLYSLWITRTPSRNYRDRGSFGADRYFDHHHMFSKNRNSGSGGGFNGGGGSFGGGGSSGRW